MQRYEVSAEQHALVADLFPANGRRGGQWWDHRTLPNAVLWVLHTGAQWRERPERYGPRKTAHHQPTVWRRDGPLARLPERLRPRLDERGLIDHEVWCVDASLVRAGRSAAGGGESARGSRPTTPSAAAGAGAAARSTSSPTGPGGRWQCR